MLATALAFAKPAVLSDVGGFGEVAATGAGVLVAPGDVGSLAAALGGLLGDEAERARLARRLPRPPPPGRIRGTRPPAGRSTSTAG